MSFDTAPSLHAGDVQAQGGRRITARLRAAVQPASAYGLSTWLFLRGLGVVYAIAFASLWVQIEGLIGERGILPVGEYLDAVGDHTGAERYRIVPTILWLASGDAMLHVVCAAGVLASALVVLDIATAAALVALWGLYLSLTVACQVFCNFQWDALLLETGCIAILVAPWTARWRAGRVAPPRLALWTLYLLAFRLWFASGAVKLLSGDPTWRDLSALTHHYETQPLATWVGWWVHQLPAGFHAFSTLIVYAIELVVPFGIFLGRHVRRVAFLLFASLMLLIAVTGNYTFFNMLTVVLCIPLVHDGFLARWWRLGPRRSPANAFELVGSSSASGGRGQMHRVQIAALAILAPVLMGLGTTRLAGQMFGFKHVPTPLLELVRWVAPLRSVNSYGLFARMTTTRPEIILEGTRDGATWQAYEFKWKPGDPKRHPGFVAPHQPRLDWQLWFAALDDARRVPWFWQFEQRLLEASPPVRALLAHDPFGDRPPQRIRALLYEYSFTTPDTLRATGRWWNRRRLGAYAPTLGAPLSP